MTDTFQWPPPDAIQKAQERCVFLARQAVGLCDPNPRVGCVLLDAQGQVLGEGHTQRAGSSHAEVMALQDALSKGHSVRGACAVVSLEPCAHHGRTGPCTEALIAAGIGSVHIACTDPFPAVSGQGVARLQAAGVACAFWQASPALSAALDINRGFFHRVRTGRPWVRMKAALSLDGRMSLANGHSQWITGPEARADVQCWRARAQVLLTGIGTVLADDPLMNVRGQAHDPLPQRIVVDPGLRMPESARIFNSGGEIILATVQPGSAGNSAQIDPSDELAKRTQSWRQKGVAIRSFPPRPEQPGHLQLAALLDDLGQRQCNELHIEAGSRLQSSFLQEDLVDELLIYLAPKVLFNGPSLAFLAPPLGFERADASPDWHWLETSPLGKDLRLRLLRRL